MKLLRRLTGLFRRAKLDADMADEMRLHVELQAGLNLKAGMSPADARHAALRQFGSVTGIQEQAREARGWLWLEQSVQDLRLAVRALGRNPSFTLVAVLTLALGMGATTAIFSVTYAVVLRPLPFPESGRLMALWAQTPQVERLAMGAADHRDLQAQNTVFEDIALLRGTANYNLTGDGEPERLLGAQVGANLFPLLRVQPALGRGFMSEENQPGRERVVILSHGLWQRRFAGNPGVIGQTVTLENSSYTVVGIMSAGFSYPTKNVQIWTPLTVNPANFQTRAGYMHTAVARLKAGISQEQAQTELDVIATRLSQTNPGPNLNLRFHVTPLRQDIAGAARKPLFVLLAAALSVLLIGCCNLVNLLLARALARSRETAVRAALGATPYRLVRQTAAELVPLLGLGAVAGVLAAKGGIALLLPWLPASLPGLDDIRINLPVLLFSGAVLAFTASLVVLLPARQAARAGVGSSLAGDARTSTAAAGRVMIRHLLIVGQVALTVMLLAGAGLLARSFALLKEVDPGFRPAGVLSLRLAIPNSKYRGDDRVAQFCQRLLEAVRTVPGVEAAGMGNRLPLGGASGVSTVFFEQGNQPPGVLVATDETTVTPDYFRAMGITLRQGRDFTEFDAAKAPPVVVVDEAVARKAWPGENPLGKRMRSSPGQPWAEVVGVVGYVRHESLEKDERLQIYWNYLQRARDRITLVVRTTRDAHSLVTPIREAIRSVDADQPVYDIRTMTETLDQSLALRWFNTVVVALFATASLLLAMVGIYGVMSWTVRQRTREIGIRLALGAQRGEVLGMVLRNGLKLVGTGIGIGLLGAAGLSFLIRSLLFSVAPTDPITFAAAPLVLVVATLVACWLPARRAAKVDPVVALRAE